MSTPATIRPQAAQVFSGVLQANPDLKGVWGTNLYGVQGVITALAEAGKTGEVVVMAPDALPNEVDWLRNGEAYGLLAEKPYQVAYQAVYAALENLAGHAGAGRGAAGARGRVRPHDR